MAAAPCEEASELLSYYLQQLIPLQAKAFSLTNKQPDQLNNESRNCLTHMAKAFAAENSASMAQEMERARGHLERMARDCLKLSIAEIGTRIRQTSHQIRNITLRPPTKEFLDQIRKFDEMREGLRVDKGAGEPVVERYAYLLKEMEDFYNRYNSQWNSSLA